jgi:putative CocE/NonD family hydrolase
LATSRRDILLASLAAVPALAAKSVFGAEPAKTASPAWQLPAKRPVRVVENEWIPMPDGARLGARLWIPEGAEQTPVPVVLEYIPYRKRDAYRRRDSRWGPQLAQYGVAYARVDVRGSGDSDGVMVDEYAPPELNDGVSVIAWLARQPWSNGAVGMRGISWGGINTLQVAAMAPPELKAIMPMGCCDIRFTDDAHYIGGALGLPNFQWGVGFKQVMSAPPDPQIVGTQWEAMWRRRLDATPAILAEWVSHQRYDAYWQRGSIAVDYSGIKCPVYVVDGWIDTYANVVGRLLENLKVPRKGLIGPWGHSYPDAVNPGPGLDWAHEEVRWWQQWLLGVDTGIMDEPMFRAYMPYSTPWEVFPNEVPGRWIAEPTWPAPEIVPAVWHLNAGGTLARRAGAPTPVHYVGDKIVGLDKLQWLPFPPSGMPGEQGEDDQKSLVFNSSPLESDLEILGYPTAKVRVAANVPVAKLAVRMTDVTPEGKSWLVSWGLLNLTHRDSHEHPTALKPGESYDVEIKLFMVAHRFKRGHRIRIALSESLWPVVWPSPEIATLTLELGSSSVVLPVRPAPKSEAPFPIPVLPPNTQALAGMRGPPPEDSVHRGPDGRLSVKHESPEASYEVPDIGTALTRGGSESNEITEGAPNSCVWRQESIVGYKRGEWDCRSVAAYEITSTAEAFLVKESLKATKGGEIFFQQETVSKIARDLV